MFSRSSAKHCCEDGKLNVTICGKQQRSTTTVTTSYLHVFFVHLLTDVINTVLGQTASVNVQLCGQIALRCDGQLSSEGRLHLISAHLTLSVGDEGQDGLTPLPIQVLETVVIHVTPGEHLLHLFVLWHHGEFSL